MISLDLPQLIVKSKLVVQARLTDKSSIRWNGHVPHPEETNPCPEISDD